MTRATGACVRRALLVEEARCKSGDFIVHLRVEESMRKKVIETPEMYKNQIYPNIVNQDLSWISNILDTNGGPLNIIYSDERFVLIPDDKWDEKDLGQIYCLAILRDGSIRSIRNLGEEHIPLLEHINRKAIDVICKKYNLNAEYSNKFRSYFHYRPTSWHAHIHFNLIDNKIGGAIVDVAHTVHNVVQNLKLSSDYYKTACIEVIEKN